MHDNSRAAGSPQDTSSGLLAAPPGVGLPHALCPPQRIRRHGHNTQIHHPRSPHPTFPTSTHFRHRSRISHCGRCTSNDIWQMGAPSSITGSTAGAHSTSNTLTPTYRTRFTSFQPQDIVSARTLDRLGRYLPAAAPGGVAGFYAFIPFPPGTALWGSHTRVTTRTFPHSLLHPSQIHLALKPIQQPPEAEQSRLVGYSFHERHNSTVAQPTLAPEWYTITHGRFVGIIDQYVLSQTAIAGVPNAVRKAYGMQALALHAFNQALTWGSVQVVL
ncbi:hypothetical protein C8J57DRAFT_1517597 [Mycena rebaudengoi]|nr:hypothetical protein C8J57DRAFT_1517597 [Mycena rebaudengoi]